MKKLTDCPYLIYKDKNKGCANCLGYRCTSGSREKKLSDVSVCRDENEWVECLRYLEASQSIPYKTVAENPDDIDTVAENGTLSTGTETEEVKIQITVPRALLEDESDTCPYLTTNITDSDYVATCLAKNIPVSPRKNCRNYEHCTRYLIAKLSGTSPRGGE